MFKKIFLQALIAFLFCAVNAQTKKETKSSAKTNCGCAFQSVTQAGIMNGEQGASLLVQTIIGMRYKTWFAGTGIGLDHYLFRTVPFFLDIRKEILKSNRTPFLYADGGIHFSWLRQQEKPNWGKRDFNDGWYYDVGAGYSIGFQKNDAILLSLGFGKKTMKEKRIINTCPFVGPCPSAETQNYSYKLNRLSLKVGWKF